VLEMRIEKDIWSLTSSNGVVRFCSAEQVLSHMFPPLAGIKGKHVTVKVEPDIALSGISER